MSSINTEVFRDTEDIDNSFPTVLIPLPRALQAPGAPIHHPVIHITGTMEAAEAELHQKNLASEDTTLPFPLKELVLMK